VESNAVSKAAGKPRYRQYGPIFEKNTQQYRLLFMVLYR